MSNSKKTKHSQQLKVGQIRRNLEIALRQLYRLDRIAGESAALYCIIRLQQLIINLRDNHH